MAQWHYALNGQQFGPVPAEDIQRLLAAGTLDRNSLVWREGMAGWQPLGVAMPPARPAAESFGGQTAAPSYAQPDPFYLEREESHPFEFRGRPGEYFRIWIVNVVLTLITFGIYAAWAKVRTRRYFYGNTLLDGKPFDFTGNPVAILKGNLIFGGLFVLYALSINFYPLFALVIFALIFLIAPWLVTKALRFRAHNTVHRNVRFNFRGTTGEAYGVYLGLAFLIPFTLGLIGPYAQFRQKQFFLSNVGWGNAPAEMRGEAGFYYKTFFKMIGLMLLVGFLTSLAAPLVFATLQKTHIARQMQTKRLQSVETPSQQDPQEEEENPGQHYRRNREVYERPGQMETLAFALPFYILMFAAGIYYRVRTNNYALNCTQWGGLGRLVSTVRVRDLLWIYFSNGVVVLCTLGLAIPWVKIRMARYLTSHTRFLATGSLDSVAQAYGTADSAMGDAGADIFDVEVGF